MAEGYEIVEHDIECGISVLVLRPEGKTDFLAKMAKKPKQLERYRLIVQTVERIQYEEPETYYGSLIRSLDSEISLVEIKIGHKVIRIMAYVHRTSGPSRLVLLFDFNGHQGTGKIPPSLMDKARHLARIARMNMEED